MAPVRIGRGAVVGINCVVMPGVELGDGAVLAPGGVATAGTRIPAHELWGGIPARKLKDLPRGE
jgi:acetyltransferase-like isoleucine patch superfamily enzyme